MARRKKISHVETSALFRAISAEYGFDNEVVLSYFQDIDELQQLWETNNEVGYIHRAKNTNMAG